MLFMVSHPYDIHMKASLPPEVDGIIVFALILMMILSAPFAAPNALGDPSEVSLLNNTNLSVSIYDVHVYVFNKDDDYLKVSLFIDSMLKDSYDISSDSEKKFNAYPLPKKSHNFKIT